MLGSQGVVESLVERGIIEINYNELPPNFLLNFCISHPHGTCQRISFGSVRVVKEGTVPGAEIDEMKQLMVEITKQNTIGEKRFYFTL